MSLRKTFEDSAVSSIGEILDDIFPRDQRELDHEVARTTGESLSDIRRHGFSLQSSLPLEPHPEDLILDWDSVDEARSKLLRSLIGLLFEDCSGRRVKFPHELQHRLEVVNRAYVNDASARLLDSAQ